jgi:hypothetical protein
MASTDRTGALAARWPATRGAARGAALVSLLIGLFFAFVRAPHPWGWEGIDQYHDLAQALARGEPFGTTDVPWGYAYFVAAFYRLFGPHAWVPVLAQVVVNAAIPLLLYRLVAPLAGTRTAAVAAWLAAVFSFNTIYASTLASDSICTALFLAALVVFARGHRRTRWIDFAASGLLFGLVPQFRPNLILLPPLIALAYLLFVDRSRRAAARMATMLILMAAALLPWTVRNFTLTGRLLPTSTHGGVQLWYGTLQVGPYLESRAYNPRSAFEAAAFDYTSLAGDSLIVTGAGPYCGTGTATLVYWTDRDPARRRLTATERPPAWEIPGQPDATAIYYYAETSAADGSANPVPLRTPLDGDVNPAVYFVSADHLGDLDRHHDLLDVFDLTRMIRHVAWQMPVPNAAQLDLDASGAITIDDVRAAVIRLLGDGAGPSVVSASDVVRWDAAHATLHLSDGSTLEVPRVDRGRVTDLAALGTLASTLLHSRRPWRPHLKELPPAVEACQLVAEVRINDVYYRREVHLMGRYTALAFDNIGRDPWAFAAASAYRIVRLFVLRGAGDTWTAHQFTGSGLVYAAGQALSIGYLLVFAAGVVIAVRRRSPMRVLLLPIVYVPLTICVVLTNMRYTITVQPLMFAFVAMAIGSALGGATGGAAASGARATMASETAHSA